MQNITSEKDISSKKQNYLLLLEGCKTAQYLEILSYSDMFYLLKFRTDNHKLPVETGRYKNIEYSKRLCTKCLREVGDKYHYLFSCPLFESERVKYIPLRYRKNPNILKYKELLGHRNKKVLQNLCKFIKVIFKNVK